MGKIAKGVDAVKKVGKAFSTLDALTKKIREENPKTAVTSCNATAQIVGELIVGDKPLTAAQGLGGKSPADRVKIIEALLKSPKMVYINITPDHHFIVVPIEDTMVSILQGFQGVFHLVDWIKNRGEGVINKAEFLKAMGELVGGDKAAMQAAALKLFSYQLAYEGKPPGADQKGVEDEIKKYYKATPVTIAAVSSADL